MVSRDLIQGICFLSQTAVGLVGNSFLLTVHVFLLPQLHQPKPTDLIVSHLALVHTVMLLTRVVTVTVSALSLRQLQTDVGCKMFAFVYRATRGVSMGTTSLLSATQAITIGPSHPSWTRLKAQMSKRIFPACVWFINMLVEANLLVKMVLSPNVTSRGNSFHDNYCVVSRINTYLSALLQGPLLTLMTVQSSPWGSWEVPVATWSSSSSDIARGSTVSMATTRHPGPRRRPGPPKPSCSWLSGSEVGATRERMKRSLRSLKPPKTKIIRWNQ
uniref:Vomeronasal type-1 receptor n=1 Tax=Ornithorhynchus anatinus TaxID=9258 RepID=A0A6I8PN29_ORNAN